MTDTTNPTAPTERDQEPAAPRIGFSVRHEDLVLLVKVGDEILEAQLAPQGALELARDLLSAGLDHAQARMEKRVQAALELAGDPPRSAH